MRNPGAREGIGVGVLSCFVALFATTAFAQAQQSGGMAALPASIPGALSRGVNDLKTPLALMRICYDRVSAVKDYTATLLREERVGGTLEKTNHILLKVRHKPFSVYMKWLAPGAGAGREALYVEGWNGGKVVCHDEGLFGKFVKRIELSPTSRILLAKSRHPITQVGLFNLTRRLRDRWTYEVTQNEATVETAGDRKIAGRPCWFVRVLHPNDKKKYAKELGGKYMFYELKCFVDKEHRVPVQIEGYDWPSLPKKNPFDLLGVFSGPSKDAKPTAALISRYTYKDLKFDVGLTDKDFDWRNPDYAFQ